MYLLPAKLYVRLLLNLKKTDYMVFTNKNVNKEVGLVINNEPIQHVR